MDAGIHLLVLLDELLVFLVYFLHDLALSFDFVLLLHNDLLLVVDLLLHVLDNVLQI